MWLHKGKSCLMSFSSDICSLMVLGLEQVGPEVPSTLTILWFCD